MYYRLDNEEIINYVKNSTNLFSKKEKLSSEEISDGNLNLVFRVKSSDNNRSVIIKQSLPSLRIDETMKLCLERIDLEYKYLTYIKNIQPKLVPEVYHFDKKMKVIIMEDLYSHEVLRNILIQGIKSKNIGSEVGSFLAKSLFFTSDLYLEQLKKKRLVKDFINPELCKITEDLVFTQPYYECEKNNIDPWLMPKVKEIIGDEELKKSVAKLRYKFMNNSASLLHGDLHTGSIMVNKDGVKIIDGEFAFFGPMGFDIGAFIANIILNYLSQEVHMEEVDSRKEYKEYLRTIILDTWNKFESEFRMLWSEFIQCPLEATDEYMNEYIQEVFEDTIGYAGCKMIRRIYGLAHVSDIDSIIDKKAKEKVQNKALARGRALIVKRKEFYNINNLIEKVTMY